MTPLDFEPTLPAGEPDLTRLSAFMRYLDERGEQAQAAARTGFDNSLSPSLLMDLQRDGGGDGRERGDLLSVFAASRRHARALVAHLRCDEHVLPLSIFPAEQLVHCPVPFDEVLAARPSALRVLDVEPALLRPPGDPQASLVADPQHYRPLPQVAWVIALRGERDTLLPEIAGTAAYRLAPGVDLAPLGLGGALLAAVQRLRRETTSLRAMSDWPGLDRGRAARLLNGLYLQAGLIISRSHPKAARDSWFGK